MSDAELLQIADECIRVNILGLLRRTNGEWYVTKYTTPVVADQESYPLPRRIQAGSVRDVTLIDVEGNEFDLPELHLEYARTQQRATSARARGHFIEDNSLVLRPVPTRGEYTLCIRYRRQPSTLVLTTSVNAVQVASGAGQSVNAVAPLVAPFNATVDADLVQAGPPFDVIASGTGAGAASVFNFASATQSTERTVSGDWLCVAGESPVPQVPPVCHDLLVYAVAKMAALELGMSEKVRLLEDQYQAAAEAVYTQLGDRNEGADHKIVSPFSPLRQRDGWGWGYS